MINDPQPSESAAPGDTEAKRLQPDSGKRSADRIVVGIGDSGADHYRTALGLAARMSRQRAATITLIHGSLPRLAVAASRTEALQRHLARGREVVEEARGRGEDRRRRTAAAVWHRSGTHPAAPEPVNAEPRLQ
jgi:hypothetical protein